MSDYQPTDEQISALDLSITQNVLADIEEDETHAVVASPEFQAIIRAAREDAWSEGHRAGFSTAMRRMSDEPGAPSAKNPYREATTA